MDNREQQGSYIMSRSIQEEILSALYAIAAVLCFGFGFIGWGWAFSIKAALDCLAAIYAGFSEVRREKP